LKPKEGATLGFQTSREIVTELHFVDRNIATVEAVFVVLDKVWLRAMRRERDRAGKLELVGPLHEVSSDAQGRNCADFECHFFLKQVRVVCLKNQRA